MSTPWYNNKWIVRGKILLISAFYASIGNWIFTMKSNPTAPEKVFTPIQVAPALIVMIFLVFVAMFIQSLFEKIPKWPKLPTALYLTMLNTFVGCDWSPFQTWVVREISKIQLMALCTPILAYAGIAIGKDLDEFKKQGLPIVVVAICTFIGTFVGSALIAQVVLKIQGQI